MARHQRFTLSEMGRYPKSEPESGRAKWEREMAQTLAELNRRVDKHNAAEDRKGKKA